MSESLPIEEVQKRVNLSCDALCDIVNKFIEEELDISEVFHYTSAAGLYDILNEKKLWFTRWDCLNDYSENKYIHDIIEEGLAEYKSVPEFVDCIKQTNDLLRKCKEDSSLLSLENNLYIASFSLNGDALNMWTYYTKSVQSDGYCIGLDYGKLFSEAGLDIIVAKVVYDVDAQKNIVSELLRHLFDLFNDLGRNLDAVLDRGKVMGQSFENVVSDIGCFFKHPAFKAEEELRAVVRVKCSEKGIELPEKVRKSGGMLVPYTELGFKEEHVKSVTISPTLKNKAVLPGLYALRDNCGMKFQIRWSKIPFRAM